MTDKYEKLRNEMVDFQIKRRGVRDENVLNAMRKVPRHEFVPKSQIEFAYSDTPLPIGCGQTISQPYMVAVMTELLKPNKNKKILEIGTGCGYQTAILAEICKEVYTIERIPELTEMAKRNLKKLGYNNVFFKTGDGTIGWKEFSPFDGIIVTAGAPSVPESLKHQLSKNGGILVIPVGDRFTQSLLKITRKENYFHADTHFLCQFVPLIGEEGW